MDINRQMKGRFRADLGSKPGEEYWDAIWRGAPTRVMDGVLGTRYSNGAPPPASIVSILIAKDGRDCTAHLRFTPIPLEVAMLFSILLFASGAAAHGAVTSYVIAGKKYPGLVSNLPTIPRHPTAPGLTKDCRYDAYNTAGSQRVIQRQWPGYSPITSCTDAALRCNGGRSASENATVVPGDKVAGVWKQWTHSQGPIMVWLFKCAGAFSACDGSGAGWFKIDEAGFKGGSGVFLDSEKGSGWDIAKLVGGDKQWTSTIPSGIAPGNYLIRHELIALHQANAPQFYPECAQLVIGGSGSAQPDASYKTAIPGYCKQSDPNIRVGSLDAMPEHSAGCANSLARSPSTITLGPRHTRFPAPRCGRVLGRPKGRKTSRREILRVPKQRCVRWLQTSE